jgi:hypothetical protein
MGEAHLAAVFNKPGEPQRQLVKAVMSRNELEGPEDSCKCHKIRYDPTGASSVCFYVCVRLTLPN